MQTDENLSVQKWEKENNSTNSCPTNTCLFICMSKRPMVKKGILSLKFSLQERRWCYLHIRAGSGRRFNFSLLHISGFFHVRHICWHRQGNFETTTQPPLCNAFFPIMKCPFLLLQNYQVTFSPSTKITRWLFLLLPGDANLWMEPIWLGAAGEEENKLAKLGDAIAPNLKLSITDPLTHWLTHWQG